MDYVVASTDNCVLESLFLGRMCCIVWVSLHMANLSICPKRPKSRNSGLHRHSCPRHSHPTTRKRAGRNFRRACELSRGKSETNPHFPLAVPLLGDSHRSLGSHRSDFLLLLLLLLAAGKNCNRRKSENRDGLHIFLLVTWLKCSSPQ